MEIARLTAERDALREAIAPGIDARSDFVTIAEIQRRQADAYDALLVERTALQLRIDAAMAECKRLVAVEWAGEGTVAEAYAWVNARRAVILAIRRALTGEGGQT